MEKVVVNGSSGRRAAFDAVPRSTRRVLMMGADLVCFPALLAIAMWLSGALALADLRTLTLLVLAGVIAPPVFVWRGVYRSIARYMGMDLLFAACGGMAICALAATAALALALDWSSAVRTGAAFTALGVAYIVASRSLAGLLARYGEPPGEPVIIYGAGEKLASLASWAQSCLNVAPVALIDDTAALVGNAVEGVDVYPPASLASLISRHRVSRVLLGLPSGPARRRVLARLAGLPVRAQAVPDIDALMLGGGGRPAEARDVDLAELLDRDPVPPMADLLQTCIRGRAVLVTGAGGSIGAALCRQVLEQQPQRLILLDVSEAALYRIDRELRAILDADPSLRRQNLVVPLIGSVHNRRRLREVLETYSVHTVYHAAAYKHVPLVEHNMIEGVRNNVFGTLDVAEECLRRGVANMVLVSTDKAVRPNSVMGATKRLAELVLQALHERGGATKLSIVRFGNVLGASGSIVPLFREQIRDGGPVTITHREVTRYFMTIDEAVSLVIQAGSMAQGGDVFALDMGKPVRVQDLAEKMIGLLGLTVRDDDHPEGDIEIRYINLRPGEKLHEELAIGDKIVGTGHPMILRAEDDFIPWPQLERALSDIRAAGAEQDCARVRQLLLQCVSDYRPVDDVEDLVWREQRKARADNVTELPRQRRRDASRQVGSDQPAKA